MTTEIYNSVDNKFVPGPDLPLTAYAHCMTHANSTHIILAGGYYNPAGQGAYVLEKSTNTWTTLKNMTSLRRERPGCFAYQSNGELMLIVAGGINNDVTSEIYSFATDLWTPGPSLPHYFRWGASIPYKDTFIMVMGVASNSVIEYDVQNNSFSLWAMEFVIGNRYYNSALFLSSDS